MVAVDNQPLDMSDISARGRRSRSHYKTTPEMTFHSYLLCWEHSALLVPEIYGNAELTILAGRSDNSRKGFVNLAKWYKPIALPVEVPYAMHPDKYVPGTITEQLIRQTALVYGAGVTADQACAGLDSVYAG